ncbi:MAG: DeoR/GlpR family DNA-binding transcription regulator [Candidatus Omnitrophota bacterium]
MGILIGAERRQRILEILTQKEFVPIEFLVQELKASPATIRRDLMTLETEGSLERVHGGATLSRHRPGINRILTLSEREPKLNKEKETIGTKAASFVRDGETIILDGGTTTYQVARHLINRHIQIITNSLPIAGLFANSLTTEVFLLGGTLYPKRGVFLGFFTEEMAIKVNSQKAFLGVAGITEDGFTNTDLQTVELQRNILKKTQEVFLVADHSKWAKNGMYLAADFSEVDAIISDRKPSVFLAEVLKKNKVEIIVA